MFKRLFLVGVMATMTACGGVSTEDDLSIDLESIEDFEEVSETESAVLIDSSDCDNYYVYQEGCGSCGPGLKSMHVYCVTGRYKFSKISQYCVRCN